MGIKGPKNSKVRFEVYIAQFTFTSILPVGLYNTSIVLPVGLYNTSIILPVFYKLIGRCSGGCMAVEVSLSM